MMAAESVEGGQTVPNGANKSVLCWYQDKVKD